MFGYIMPCVPELKVRELEQYRQYYCGLCRALSERYHRTSELAYDAAFVHLLADGLSGKVTAAEKVKCAAHPFRGVMVKKTDCAAVAADANLLMAYAKAADDVADTGSLKARLALFALQGKKRRAEENVPDMTKDMEACAKKIRDLEKSSCDKPDEIADAYGVLFGKILSDLDVVQSHILYDLGYNIGRWVYLIDAWDDMEDDEKHGQFNVYNLRMRSSGETKNELRQSASFSFHYTLAQAADALGRLQLKKNRALLDNIVRLGLYRQTQSVLAGAGRLDHESIRSSRRF